MIFLKNSLNKCLLFLAFTIPVNTSLHANWSSPVMISIAGNQAPVITLDPYSNATAAWVSGDNLTQFSLFLPAGSSSWSQSPVSIASATGTKIFSSPALFPADDGSLAAGWLGIDDQAFIAQDIQISKLNFNSNIWSSPIISSPTLPKKGNLTGDRQGNIFAGWTISSMSKPDSQTIYLEALSKEASKFSSFEVATSDSTDSFKSLPPSLTAVNGNAFALWKIDLPQLAIQWNRYNFAADTLSETSHLSWPIASEDIVNFQVAMDENENVIALFAVQVSDSSQVVYSGSLSASTNTWSTFQAISNPNNFANLESLTVDKFGNAVAVWTEQLGGIDGAEFVVSSSLSIGESWTDPVIISGQHQAILNLQVVSDSSGNAVTVWGTFDPGSEQIQVAALPFGGTWSTTTTLSSSGTSPAVTLNDQQNAIAVWQDTHQNEITVSSFFGIFPAPAPLPPKNFIGKIIKTEFLNKTDYALVTHWNPSLSQDVKCYRIYKNGALVATIPATAPLKYEKRLPFKHLRSVYTISAVNLANFESARVVLELQ